MSRDHDLRLRTIANPEHEVVGPLCDFQVTLHVQSRKQRILAQGSSSESEIQGIEGTAPSPRKASSGIKEKSTLGKSCLASLAARR